VYRAGKHKAHVPVGRNPLWNTRVKDECGQEVFISSLDAAGYINEEFCAAFEVFCISENLECLPFNGGWAEQPEWITQAISVLKIERWKIDEEEREVKRQEKENVRKYGKR
jgi:hypothetical protein